MNNYFYEIHNDPTEWNFDNIKGNKSDLDKKNKKIDIGYFLLLICLKIYKFLFL